ncbi:MAG: cysteine synthase [Thiotrichales bacterium]|nr:MAG: cysteine synthase [Thiotrichales bacterium]
MLIQQNSQGMYLNYSSSITRPKLIKIANNLTIAVFELMKLLPAKYTILKALHEKKLDPNYPIIETSSGTYALGMGIVCAELGIPFIIISDPIIDANLTNRLQALGGKVQIVKSSVDSLDVQTLRLAELDNYLRNMPEAFWPAQYDNPDNRHAYYDFAELLLNRVGNNFTLVGAVGSGGSTCGAIERLRQDNNDIKLIGVDTFGSALFGLPKKARKLRGLGNSLLPKNVVHNYFDMVHWVSADCAYNSVRNLHSATGLFRGPTTGAAFHVASWYAANNKNEEVVFISADPGARYIDTVYNDAWLKKNDIDLTTNFSNPTEINKLSEIVEPWSYFNWQRKTYNEVVTDYA